ncbi:hypothetical protein G9U52_36965, partial [Paenibacillus sp. S3N08]|nr:hypothetical protein [Paenibacillus agricola]
GMELTDTNRSRAYPKEVPPEVQAKGGALLDAELLVSDLVFKVQTLDASL